MFTIPFIEQVEIETPGSPPSTGPHPSSLYRTSQTVGLGTGVETGRNENQKVFRDGETPGTKEIEV